MIVHKTFSVSHGITINGMQKGQEQARAEAEAFIARELSDEDVLAICESALPSTWSQCLASVTVWYKRH